MSTESNMEQAVKDAGFEIMSGPPSSVEQAQTTETPAPQTEGVPENNTPTEPAVQQTDLARLARDNQNVHTAAVSQQTNKSIELLMKIEIPAT